MKLPKDPFFLFSALVAAFILIGGLLFTLFAPPSAPNPNANISKNFLPSNITK